MIPDIPASRLVFFYSENRVWIGYNRQKLIQSKFSMKYSLAGLWQLSPLTDLSVPQDDIRFPAPLSQVLPENLSEESIREQEWHLMHDIEADEALLSYAAIDLVLEGIDYFAEVRLNGVALFDCDGSQSVYRKNIRPLINPGRNRFEILFLEQDDDWLVEEDMGSEMCSLSRDPVRHYDPRMGIWREPYLQLIRHVRLEHVTTEQVWHHGGGCELLVNLYYHTYSPGLISASVKFDAMTYNLPIDVRNDHASALFQVEAPKYYNPDEPCQGDLYRLMVRLDDQEKSFDIALSECKLAVNPI